MKTLFIIMTLFSIPAEAFHIHQQVRVKSCLLSVMKKELPGFPGYKMPIDGCGLWGEIIDQEGDSFIVKTPHGMEYEFKENQLVER